MDNHLGEAYSTCLVEVIHVHEHAFAVCAVWMAISIGTVLMEGMGTRENSTAAPTLPLRHDGQRIGGLEEKFIRLKSKMGC